MKKYLIKYLLIYISYNMLYYTRCMYTVCNECGLNANIIFIIIIISYKTIQLELIKKTIHFIN